MTVALVVALWVAVVAMVFGVWQRHALARLWREPMLRSPVVIFESDDWGPGPPADADALDRVAAILGRHRDARGRSPVMTLGVLLAVADTDAIRSAATPSYVPQYLSDARFAPILAAMRRGMEAGVLAPQLHGMEHYWPAAVVAAAHEQPAVRDWLTREGVPRTEELPSPLQSRWVDASALPARELAPDDVARAAASETDEFDRVFGARSVAVVPPTFVWNDAVEAAWAKGGVECVVTPGKRYTGRDRTGGLYGAGESIANGDVGRSGLRYLVRDDYFEPALGHRADTALAAVVAKSRAGRPTLFETHRFNFVGDRIPQSDALREIDHLIASVLRALPGVRFMATADLARAIATGDPVLIEQRTAARIPIWLARAALSPRLRKLAVATGAIVPALALHAAATLVGKMAPRNGTAV